jgi:hypothetical protein
VKDKHGALMPNLTKDDFEIFEDGKQADREVFHRRRRTCRSRSES